MSPECLGEHVATDVGKSRKTVEKKAVNHALGIIRKMRKDSEGRREQGMGGIC